MRETVEACVAAFYLEHSSISYLISHRYGRRSGGIAVLWRLHAIDARRLQERRSWVVSFSILRPFGPTSSLLEPISRRFERLLCEADPGAVGRARGSQQDARDAAEAVGERVAAFWSTSRLFHYLSSRRCGRCARRRGLRRTLRAETR